MVLNPERKVPPNVKQKKAENKFGHMEKEIIPIKKPMHPIKNSVERYFWGEIFAIISEPINAPSPSEEVKIPISNSFKFKLFFPKIGTNEIKGNPKILKIKVTIKSNLSLVSLNPWTIVFLILSIEFANSE